MGGTAKNRPAKKAPPPKKRETRNEKKEEAKKKEESVKSGQGPEHRITHNCATFTVPMRQENHLRHCFMCDRSSKLHKGPARAKGVKEEKKEIKKEDTSKVAMKRKESDAKGEVVKKKSDENGEETGTKEKKSEDNDYIKCGFDKCQQRMHKSCVDNYNCSEYSPTQAQLLFNAKSPVCPAHFCWNCYDERSKNASRFGDLADCERCLRSFHLNCVPAGCKIKENGDGKRKTFVCHYHAPSKGRKISKQMRLKYCIDCEEIVEEDDKKRVECKGCTNIFHKDCGYAEIKGSGANGENFSEGYCSVCVSGTVIVPKQTILAYYGVALEGLRKGYYPAKALAIADINSDLVKSKRLGSNLGKTGWIPVMWIWKGLKTPFYNMVHKSQVQKMTQGCEKNLTDEDFLEELKKSEKFFMTPTVPLDNEEMRKTITIVHENVYFKGVTRVSTKREVDVCSCKPDSKNIKCNTDECENRSAHVECGKECDDVGKGITCANRSLQKPLKERAEKKYEVKLAPQNKGFGTFATQTIEPLEFIFEYAGEVIDKKEKERREDRLSKLRSDDEGTYMMELANSRYVDARFKGGESRYANHSCDPNAIVKAIEVPIKCCGEDKAMFEKKLSIEALRKINAGEEITFDYGLDKSRGLALDKCRCGSPNCIGKIGKKKDDDDGEDERYDKNDLIMVSDDEEEEETEDDEESDEEKENKGKGKKRTPAIKASKKNEKSVEMKKVEKPTRKRERRLSDSSPGPSTSQPSVKRSKRNK